MRTRGQRTHTPGMKALQGRVGCVHNRIPDLGWMLDVLIATGAFLPGLQLPQLNPNQAPMCPNSSIMSLSKPSRVRRGALSPCNANGVRSTRRGTQRLTVPLFGCGLLSARSGMIRPLRCRSLTLLWRSRLCRTMAPTTARATKATTPTAMPATPPPDREAPRGPGASG